MHDDDVQEAYSGDDLEPDDGNEDSDDEAEADADDELDDEDGKPALTDKKRTRTTWKTEHLPKEATKHHLWRKAFLPTFVRYAGALLNPWSMDDEDELRRVLELIWKFLIPDVPYTDQLHVIVRYLVRLFFASPTVNMRLTMSFSPSNASTHGALASALPRS